MNPFLPAPHLHAPLQCTKVLHAVFLRIPRLEFDEELQGRLIRLPFQALKHLGPVIFEQVGPVTAGLIAHAALFESVDYHTPGARILAPGAHEPEQRFVLPAGKATRELRAQLLEELCAIDVREPFEAATY